MLAFGHVCVLDKLHARKLVEAADDGAVVIPVPQWPLVIAGGAFCSTKSELRSVLFPEGTTELAENAFEECHRLTTLELPPSCHTVGDRAFCKCTGLTGTLKFPEGTTKLGHSAFYGWSVADAERLPFKALLQHWFIRWGSEPSELWMCFGCVIS